MNQRCEYFSREVLQWGSPHVDPENSAVRSGGQVRLFFLKFFGYFAEPWRDIPAGRNDDPHIRKEECMRGVFLWLRVWGAVLGCLVGTAAARAEGFWVTLAAGLAGAGVPSDYNEFWFDTQHGPPLAIVSLNGGFTAQATTGGGTTVFSPLGTPVLLPVQDGYATLTASNGSVGSSSFPASALPRFAGGPQASGAPQTGLPVPPDAPRVSVGLSPPTSNGSRVVTVDVSDPNGNPLGSGQVTVPDGGWWVIGLGPDSGGRGGGIDGGSSGGGSNPDNPNTGGEPEPPPQNAPPPFPPIGEDGNEDGGAPPPVGGMPGPRPPLEGNPGPVATPEPASICMVALGGLTVAGWRRRRRRKR
jgi:hypothetical protein